MNKKVAPIIFLVMVLIFTFLYPFLKLSPTYSESISNIFKNMKNFGFAYPFYYYSGLKDQNINLPQSTEDTNTLYYRYKTSDFEKLFTDKNLKAMLIKEVDKDRNSFGLVIKNPENDLMVGVLQYATVSCLPKSTWVLGSNNKTLLNSEIMLFDSIETGDLLLTYCSNESCTAFGKECLVIKENMELDAK